MTDDEWESNGFEPKILTIVGSLARSAAPVANTASQFTSGFKSLTIAANVGCDSQQMKKQKNRFTYFIFRTDAFAY